MCGSSCFKKVECIECVQPMWKKRHSCRLILFLWYFAEYKVLFARSGLLEYFHKITLSFDISKRTRKTLNRTNILLSFAPCLRFPSLQSREQPYVWCSDSALEHWDRSCSIGRWFVLGSCAHTGVLWLVGGWMGGLAVCISVFQLVRLRHQIGVPHYYQ